MVRISNEVLKDMLAMSYELISNFEFIEGRRHSLLVHIYKTCCHQETTANPLQVSTEAISIPLFSLLPHKYHTIPNLNHAVAETIGVDVAP